MADLSVIRPYDTVHVVGVCNGQRRDVQGMVATHSGDSIKLWVEVGNDVEKMWFMAGNIESIAVLLRE